MGERLDGDLRALGGDAQLGVEYAWRLPLPAPTPATPGMIHCGLEPARLLDGVGYVQLYSFGEWDPGCEHQISSAIQAVAGAPALVLDLRDDVDDLPWTVDWPDPRENVAYVASYLLAGCSHLDDAWDRVTGQTTERWTLDGLPGPRFGDTKPLYILTSTRTFGAGEEFAYDLQSLGRATIVGQRTAGAAGEMAVGQVGDHLLVQVPTARITNPVTKTNWFRIGVQPDVLAPADQALATALGLAHDGRVVHRASLAEASRPPSGRAITLRSGGAPWFALGHAGTNVASGPLRGLRFLVDTVAPYAASRVLSRVAGVVEFANGRGRFDVAAVSQAPPVSRAGVTIADPLARPGDYYLFDNTGFILVRPTTRTFSSLVFTRADFNHTGAILPGAFLMGPFYGRTDTATAADAAARREQAPIGIQWHAQPREGPGVGHIYARGWLEIADAPPVVAGVARWFEVAAALATRSDAAKPLPPDGVEVTSIVYVHRQGTDGKPVYFTEMLAPRQLTAVVVDPARLVLPAGYTETRWPGFVHVRGMPASSDAEAARWRVLEDTTSQRERAACKQAWLPERIGGVSADTGGALLARPHVAAPAAVPSSVQHR